MVNGDLILREQVFWRNDLVDEPPGIIDPMALDVRANFRDHRFVVIRVVPEDPTPLRGDD